MAASKDVGLPVRMGFSGASEDNTGNAALQQHLEGCLTAAGLAGSITYIHIVPLAIPEGVPTSLPVWLT